MLLGNEFLKKITNPAHFFKSLLARRDRTPVSPGGFYCSCTALGAVSKDCYTPKPRITQTCNWLIVSWDRHGRLRKFSVALNSSDHKWLQMFGEKGTKTLSNPHFHVPQSKQFFDHFHPFPNQCKCKAIQIEESSKLALRPAGSDPRVGDGLVRNPLPRAFKHTFVDRMQRSLSVSWFSKLFV